jgi:PilZ domain
VTSRDNRRALRLSLHAPVAVESIGVPELELHPALERIYQRVPAAEERRGHRLSGVMRDLSTNGAFVAAEPLPLLSRVVLRFDLEELAVDAIGWILWRRLEDVEIARERGEPLMLPRGFGVLFESIALEARLRIDELVKRALHEPGAHRNSGSAK